MEVFRSKNRNFNFLLYSNLLLVVFVFLNFSEVKNIQNFSNLISLKNSGESFGKQGRTVYYDTLLNAGYSYEKVNNHFLFDCQTGPIYQPRPDISKSEFDSKYFKLSLYNLDTKFHSNFDDLNNRKTIVSNIKKLFQKELEL